MQKKLLFFAFIIVLTRMPLYGSEKLPLEKNNSSFNKPIGKKKPPINKPIKRKKKKPTVVQPAPSDFTLSNILKTLGGVAVFATSLNLTLNNIEALQKALSESTKKLGSICENAGSGFSKLGTLLSGTPAQPTQAPSTELASKAIDKLPETIKELGIKQILWKFCGVQNPDIEETRIKQTPEILKSLGAQEMLWKLFGVQNPAIEIARHQYAQNNT